MPTLSNPAFPSWLAADRCRRDCRVALRVSFTGDLGWELYCARRTSGTLPRADRGRPRCGRRSGRLPRAVLAEGREGLRAGAATIAGILAARGELDRLSKWTRRSSTRPCRHRRPAAAGSAHHVAIDAAEADASGGEPIFLPDGTPVGQVSSGAYGYSVGMSLALGLSRPAPPSPAMPSRWQFSAGRTKPCFWRSRPLIRKAATESLERTDRRMPAPAAEAVAADVAIIGGGIAGASAASELAPFCSVVLSSARASAAIHSTGRSAASFTENYGNGVIRRLAIASRSFLEAPPSGFCEASADEPRGMLTIAREDQLELLADELEQARAFVPSIRRIAVDEALARVPVLRADYVADAYLEPHSREIDVNALHQGFLRGARRAAHASSPMPASPPSAGTRLVAARHRGRHLRRRDPCQRGRRLGRYARRCLPASLRSGWCRSGAPPSMSLRRTAFRSAAGRWSTIRRNFYFKPDAGRLSSRRPTPLQARRRRLAGGYRRRHRRRPAEQATTIEVPASRIAGRACAPLPRPLAGRRLRRGAAEGFFWLAGQGGYGIKTSPALSALTAALIRGVPLPETFAATGLSADQLSPARPSLRPAALLSSSQPGVQHDHRTA